MFLSYNLFALVTLHQLIQAFAIFFMTDYVATWSQPHLKNVFNGEAMAFINDFKSIFFAHNPAADDMVHAESWVQSKQMKCRNKCDFVSGRERVAEIRCIGGGLGKRGLTQLRNGLVAACLLVTQYHQQAPTTLREMEVVRGHIFFPKARVFNASQGRCRGDQGGFPQLWYYLWPPHLCTSPIPEHPTSASEFPLKIFKSLDLQALSPSLHPINHKALLSILATGLELSPLSTLSVSALKTSVVTSTCLEVLLSLIFQDVRPPSVGLNQQEESNVKSGCPPLIKYSLHKKQLSTLIAQSNALETLVHLTEINFIYCRFPPSETFWKWLQRSPKFDQYQKNLKNLCRFFLLFIFLLLHENLKIILSFLMEFAHPHNIFIQNLDYFFNLHILFNFLFSEILINILVWPDDRNLEEIKEKRNQRGLQMNILSGESEIYSLKISAEKPPACMLNSNLEPPIAFLDHCFLILGFFLGGNYQNSQSICDLIISICFCFFLLYHKSNEIIESEHIFPETPIRSLVQSLGRKIMNLGHHQCSKNSSKLSRVSSHQVQCTIGVLNYTLPEKKYMWGKMDIIYLTHLWVSGDEKSTSSLLSGLQSLCELVQVWLCLQKSAWVSVFFGHSKTVSDKKYRGFFFKAKNLEHLPGAHTKRSPRVGQCLSFKNLRLSIFLLKKGSSTRGVWRQVDWMVANRFHTSKNYLLFATRLRQKNKKKKENRTPRLFFWFDMRVIIIPFQPKWPIGITYFQGSHSTNLDFFFDNFSNTPLIGRLGKGSWNRPMDRGDGHSGRGSLCEMWHSQESLRGSIRSRAASQHQTRIHIGAASKEAGAAGFLGRRCLLPSPREPPRQRRLLLIHSLAAHPPPTTAPVQPQAPSFNRREKKNLRRAFPRPDRAPKLLHPPLPPSFVNRVSTSLFSPSYTHGRIMFFFFLLNPTISSFFFYLAAFITRATRELSIFVQPNIKSTCCLLALTRVWGVRVYDARRLTAGTKPAPKANVMAAFFLHSSHEKKWIHIVRLRVLPLWGTEEFCIWSSRRRQANNIYKQNDHHDSPMRRRLGEMKTARPMRSGQRKIQRKFAFEK
ncbi:hypothetical protein VP01_1701g1 [Puccinia sorghi]|uniref:Uncharacterized protein n=1 Tax=Puccinia sorghi TaxID=27349 RepID=A0A0L6VFK2_9BASI|nr:hypothetical protein VP01_1701g1 [Puccinia sorghi]